MEMSPTPLLTTWIYMAINGVGMIDTLSLLPTANAQDIPLSFVS
jgi:hypothetical protein